MDKIETTHKSDAKKHQRIHKLRISKLKVWFIRSIVVGICVLGCYFAISNKPIGLLIGLGISMVIIITEIFLTNVKLDFLIIGIIGGTIGFIIFKLIEYFVFFIDIPLVSSFFARNWLLIMFGLIYLGIIVALKKYKEVEMLDKEILRRNRRESEEVKLLDTSVIIDGRITDICVTKFLSGMFIIPRFVLNELHELADSTDHIKRLRGKRGLEMLNQLQKIEDVNVKIFDKDYPQIKGVDNKLVQMAREYRAKLLTTDYGLNRLATLQGVDVLNINELANALKPIFIAGESFKIDVLKEGKEADQGVGYLDDGTMVVVENGKKFVGRRIEVVVVSTLQTSAGRIIFTQPKI